MSLSPKPGSYVRAYRGIGSDHNYSNEAMEEVDFSAPKWGGYDRYSIWRIADSSKRMMNDTAVPTFEYQDEGAGDWLALSPDEIWYAAGYIYVSSGLDADDLVRCATGKYLSPTEVFGCALSSFDDITLMNDMTVEGDTARHRAPGLDDWNGKIECFDAKKQAEAVSAGGNANSHIRCHHLTGGTAGNSISFDFQDNDAAALAVTVVGNAITVDLDTDLLEPISTADEVIAALNADADVQALGVYFRRAVGETGAGIVADSGPYTLAGGLDNLDFAAMKGVKQVFNFYGHYTNADMYVGFGYVDKVTRVGKPGDLLKASLNVSGHKLPLRHVAE
jgi:hypothetical protein